MDRVPRPGANHPAAVIPLLAWLALATQAWGQDQRPRFQAGVDITSVDVSVVDSDGRPVQGLARADFNVRIGGATRRVVTADWVPLTATAGRSGGVAVIPETFTSNLDATPGRIILIAIDQQNIRFGGAIPVRDALAAFVDRLQPSDRIGLMILGRGGRSVPFTGDRQAVKAALARVAGQKIVVSAFRHQIAMWEALAIHQDDNEVYRAVVMRECGGDPAASTGGRGSNAADVCPSEVSAQARSMAVSAIDDGERMLNALRAYFEGMRRVEAPKSLVLVTEGFILDPQRPSFIELERLAAAARTSVYALRLDQRGIDGSLSRAPAPGSAGMDRMAVRQGLDFLASATRGQVFNVVTTPDSALRSIELDLSGYYLLGVESDPADRVDEGRDVSVAVSRPGVTVRPRRRLLLDDLCSHGEGPRGARAGVAARLVGRADSDRRVRLRWTGARKSAARRSRGNRRGIFVTAIDGRRLPAARRGRQGRGQPRRRARTHAAHRRGSVGAPVRGDDRRRSRRVRVAHHCHRRQPRRQRGAEGLGAPPWFGQPEDERPRRWRACVHDGTASTHRHFDGGVRQPARIRRSLRRIGGQHDGEVRSGASARQPGVAGGRCTVRPAGGDRAIFSRVASVRRLPPGRYVLRAIATGKACQENRSGSQACTLATDFVIPASPAPPEEIFLPVADERLSALFAPTSETAAGGDERGGMEQRVNALVANRQLGAARELLEQWAATWPDDVRVAKPLALLYAASGRAVESVRLLQRHIAAYPDDVDALGLGVEWMYGLHAGGVSTSSIADDLGLARRYTASYTERNGPERPLVQLWLDFMLSSPSR